MEHLHVADTLKQAQGDALDAVNRWRGHCVERMARIEAAIGTLFEAMAESGREMKPVPHTISQRVRRLSELTQAGDIFGDAGKKLRDALAMLPPLIEQRHRIVHATATVWVNDHDDWLWAYRFQPQRKGAALEEGTFTKREAQQFEKQLKSVSSQLVSLANNYAEKLGAN